MKLAIMQPYFFPYIGYFQLISAVDKFVLLDDVNYINKGWINRNRILLNKKEYMFTLPLNKPSQNKLICETKLNFGVKERENFLKIINHAYSKATFFNDFYPILKDIIFFEDNNLTHYLYNSLVSICNYIEIKIEFLISSNIEKNNKLKAEERIIEICRKLKTNIYVNLSGGESLYNKKNFQNENLELKFIFAKPNNIVYKQFDNEFIPNLSFLDIIMFNSKDEIQKMLIQYELR